jgi:succinyl-CoA synthetase alpha subunit
MLDFDFACDRQPSVAGIVNPGSKGFHKAFFGSKELLIPIYPNLREACSGNPRASVVVNFASQRSAFSSTKEALAEESVKVIAIIAEGVPERESRILAAEARELGKVIIGPATVGGIAAGAFRIGNTGGSTSDIVGSKLNAPGSVGLVSKSGGMSNELFRTIANNSDGVFEGIAIGGDRYPGSTFLEHLQRFEEIPEIKMMVLLGEVGGIDEYAVAEAISRKEIKKPVVAWVMGTCAKEFPSRVQFGHAGAISEGLNESADAKNEALRKAGALVPKSFDELGKKILEAFKKVNCSKEARQSLKARSVPVDFQEAVSKGIVRRPSSILSSISDDRGEDVSYNKIPLEKLVESGASVGEVIGLLWFKRRLSKESTKFFELVLVSIADHGPAVSGAHNAIVASRAGKDLISCLASGLLTIGPRFGGAIDDAARRFKNARDSKILPEKFVDDMKKIGVPIPGIGHRVKSVQNPDKRVKMLIGYARKNFEKHDYLDYALAVEAITARKKNNLILNVDGAIASIFLDLMQCEGFSKEEVDEILEIGCFNAFFALGRTIGIIGHAIDQKRLKQPLYRHPTDDILYL